MLTKEKVKELMKIKGEIRGAHIKDDWSLILEKRGEEGVKEIEDRMVELGLPLKYKEIKALEFYPLGWGIISYLTIKEIFNLDEEDIKKWGASAVKFSLLMKIFMKYFASLKLISKQIPTIWREHYTIGDLEMSEFSKEKRYVILRLRNFKIDPAYCPLSNGYFSKVAEMIVKNPVTGKETKCPFKGDPYHEFLLTW